MSWDDLRFFLELARCSRLTTAARRLGVEHTTVARRVQAFEAATGVPLFLRTSTGYRLTEAGDALLPAAMAMEQAYGVVERSCGARTNDLTGLVRIGCNEAYGAMILPRHVAALTKRHPGLNIDILALPRAIQLPRHEADIVITIDRPKRGPYTVVKLAEYVLRLYASPDYLASRPAIAGRDDLRNHAFVSYIDDLALAKNVPSPNAITQPELTPVRSTSILAQRTAAEAGAGIVILPRYIGAASPALREVLAHEVEFVRTYWMTTPMNLKGVRRVRATWDFLREMAAKEAPLLSGASL
ncbi:MAG TPA: LysR family transcriptional regulator [Sphingobium sp.]